MHCNAVKYSAIQYNTVQYRTVPVPVPLPGSPSDWETGNMLGEVCRLAKSLSIQVHSLNVLNCNSFNYNSLYSLQDTLCEEEENSKEFIKSKPAQISNCVS